METIGFYEGKYYLLSNFSAHQVEYKGVKYQTAEHAYQVAKFADTEIKEKIKNAPSAFLAREFGQSDEGRTKPFDKVVVMEEIMRAKYNQHEDVRNALSETGTAVIEKNHPGDDGFWGNGPDGKGQNVMGKIWMKIREENLK